MGTLRAALVLATLLLASVEIRGEIVPITGLDADDPLRGRTPGSSEIPASDFHRLLQRTSELATLDPESGIWNLTHSKSFSENGSLIHLRDADVLPFLGSAGRFSAWSGASLRQSPLFITQPAGEVFLDPPPIAFSITEMQKLSARSELTEAFGLRANDR